MPMLFFPPRAQVLDGNGDPYAGAKLYFYVTGTSTPLDTYSDEALTTPNANPVVADGAGRFGPIFLKGQSYKVVLKTSADVTVWTQDPVPGAPFALIDDTTPQLGGTLDANGKQIRFAKGADVASASTLTLGNDGNYFDVTGTTTITAIASKAVGTVVRLHFDGALTLTHHATNLILPGGANIATAAGDEAEFVEYDTAKWQCTKYQRQAGIAQVAGKQTIWVPASAMVARTTNGAATGTAESSTNKVMSKSLDFDTATQEFAQLTVRFPKSWNEGTVTFVPYWTAGSGSGGVVWALQGVALSDDDALDTAFGTEQTSTDTLITANDVHVGPESAAITIAGSPAAGDWVIFQIKRNVSDGSDTLGVDARLLGVVIIFTTDAENDA